MTWIIISGVLTCGILPIFAAIGYGLSLILGIWFTVWAGYWSHVAVGFVMSLFLGFNPISIIIHKTFIAKIKRNSL